ncbi:hypothetical protein JCGZ_04571 [Jatropha curcas]|uniref:Uncharacterized protein n=1 Tax=Jatropha curcas TaxID=180498 RepID=A0A067LDZ5_JATCU|nr:hypothetical protein JCGZ_04571 [Jatropha curcas]
MSKQWQSPRHHIFGRCRINGGLGLAPLSGVKAMAQTSGTECVSERVYRGQAWLHKAREVGRSGAYNKDGPRASRPPSARGRAWV